MSERQTRITVVCDRGEHPGLVNEVAAVKLQPEPAEVRNAFPSLVKGLLPDWSKQLQFPTPLLLDSSLLPVGTRRAEHPPTAKPVPPPAPLVWQLTFLERDEQGAHRVRMGGDFVELDAADQPVKRPGNHSDTPFSEYREQIKRARFTFECSECQAIAITLPRRQRRYNRHVIRGEHLTSILDRLAETGPPLISIDGLRHAQEALKRQT